MIDRENDSPKEGAKVSEVCQLARRCDRRCGQV